ncbi:G-type lectin S-receptor-like serine/threonine-protein kinase SD2-5 [Durio zibethinus]|uniref:G-type lectin S-receptor-like serine/threonine-protein kinase SD2-5 n=1 Tax=Durio zibethinus TaxID=66656 RepID=A0A6P6A819_DURZI|nr:G-type lectin S-receptor-like serine/threonine-protein kinase SD2-5 [Durio zibethinus]
MKLILCSILILLVNHGSCDSAIHVGHRISLAVPLEYSDGFIGRAFLMDSNQVEPNFRVALSAEAIKGKYSCSLEVFLGDVKVWNSGHYSQFFTSDVCVLELTEDGDLQLKGPKDQVGWRTGTSGQGVERLQILRTGNLVLVDVLNRIKWQSFNFPTDVMLWGQRLDVATWLTSFPRNSTSFYTFEIQHNKIALYLNSGKLKYSYWEFKPSKNRNITFVELGSKGLELFNDKHKKIAQIIASWRLQPLKFLALGNKTGNLGLYFYSPNTQKFEASFQALNSTCDLPLACKPYGICTFSNACSCIRVLTKENDLSSDCNEGISRQFCGGAEVEMLELNGVSSVLRDAAKMVNVSKTACASLCLDDCKCVAALYSSGEGPMKFQECSLYRLVAGIKQVERGSGLNYMVKIPKGTRDNHNKPSLKKWVLIVVAVVDGLIIILVLGGLAYYFIQKRRKNLSGIDNNT